jgi:hypothetical protein
MTTESRWALPQARAVGIPAHLSHECLKVRSGRHRAVCTTCSSSISKSSSLIFFQTVGISSTTQYTSAYRPRKSAAHPVTVELDYDEFKFSKTTYTTDLHGNVNEKIHSETYTIKIARQWQQHINGDKPKDGYIAQGLTKVLFQVQVQHESLL